MTRIDWEESFSVGNDTLDQQHRKWLGMINDLHDALMHSRVEMVREARLAAVEAMVEYAENHFADEEAFMAGIGYPELVDHSQIHATFKKRITSLRDEVRSGGVVLGSEVMKTLRQWLQHHIVNEDLKYGRFAANQK